TVNKAGVAGRERRVGCAVGLGLGVRTERQCRPVDAQSARVERDGIVAAGQATGGDEIAANILAGSASEQERTTQGSGSVTVNKEVVAARGRGGGCAVGLGRGVRTERQCRTVDAQS